MFNFKKALKIGVAIIAIIAVLGGGLVALIVWEGSSAREDAPALEANVAQWLLHYTVPAGFRAMNNPLDTKVGSADVEAGHQVYTQKCEICHAYDGGGKSEIGSGQYPRPPDLRSADVQKMSDGELYRQSGQAQLRASQRHLHSMPLTGSTAHQSDQRQILRLAGGLPHGQKAGRFLEARGPQTRRTLVHSRSLISPTVRRTRTACRATISCRA